MGELWSMLDSAQRSDNGIPEALLSAKMEELKDKKSEDVKLKESLRKLADSMGAEAQRQENEGDLRDVRFNRRRSRSRSRDRFVVSLMVASEHLNSSGKDLGLGPVETETGAETAAGRGGDHETGDSPAQDPEKGKGTGDLKTEIKRRMEIPRGSQENSPRVLLNKKSQRMVVRMDLTRLLRMGKLRTVRQVQVTRRVLRRSLSPKRSLRSKRKMTELLQREITDLIRVILQSRKMRIRRTTGDPAPGTGDALGIGDHDQGVAAVEGDLGPETGGLVLETGEGAETAAIAT